MWKTLAVALISLAVAGPLVACGGGSSEATDTADSATLARYRGAIPGSDVLAAPDPGVQGSAGALTQALTGSQAMYPREAAPLVAGVNSSVSQMIALLKLVTSYPPTFYDSEKKEMVWGPFDNDDGVGQVAVWIKEEPPGGDFAYSYAFVRMMDNDLATAVAVIWGGANPDADNDEFGSGVTLWDFEANKAFADANNPDHGALDQGRFIALYMRGPDEDNAENTVAMVYSVFRGFVSKDEPASAPGDLDVFHGHVTGPEQTLSFLNYVGVLDVDDGDGDPATSAASEPEDLDVRMVFLRGAGGRAEVGVYGGDFSSNESFSGLEAVECWDADLGQEYLGYTALDSAGAEVGTQSVGTIEDCGPVFGNTLADLEIPGLDAVDPELRATLDDVARNGMPAE